LLGCVGDELCRHEQIAVRQPTNANHQADDAALRRAENHLIDAAE
jgi:hypothetical protein